MRTTKKGLTYLVEFKNKEAVKRLLAAPQATKNEYCGSLGLTNRGKNSGRYVSQEPWMEKGHPMRIFYRDRKIMNMFFNPNPNMSEWLRDGQPPTNNN